MDGLSTIGVLLFLTWYVLAFVQLFMGYGTAYRTTKMGGDNGVALVGWILVFSMAALVPGLGIYLWNKSKKYLAGEL